jgi:hypothetical protein
MTTLATAAEDILASMQGQFTTSTAVPANWKLVVGQELVADADFFTDQCCQGLGAVLITGGQLEVGTTQHIGGSLYTRMSVALTVFRCAPTIDDEGRAPTAAEELAFSRRVLDDIERMLRTVWDVAQYNWITEQDISDPEYAAVPVEGGCGGAVVTFEFAVIGDC